MNLRKSHTHIHTELSINPDITIIGKIKGKNIEKNLSKRLVRYCICPLNCKIYSHFFNCYRSRRLSRPRSLTNLVWELRSGNNCARNETLFSNNIASLIPPSKCGQRLAVTVMSPRRIGTLYL